MQLASSAELSKVLKGWGQEIVGSPLKLPVDLIEVILWVLNFLQNIISGLLEKTVLGANPELADQFSGSISTLILMTALYLLLSFVNALRKVIGYLILLGWGLLALAMLLAVLAA
ncbi:MAG TPA: hypothetical protein ENG61_00050 [Candidatus Korarchaeota archaeon]|nr:MAG: hypothetical protein DRO05_02845 [Candidatus Korarchaeota archaeon]HDD68737.1 hypothetical protein [Candidatus Korarchaeota archaeon]